MTVGPDQLADPHRLAKPYGAAVTFGDLYRVLNEILRPLLQAVRDRADGSLEPFAGQVTAITTGPPKTVTVTQTDGTQVTCRYYQWYTPVLGDRVEGVATDTVARVLGVLA